jgi:hypothetical protein
MKPYRKPHTPRNLYLSKFEKNKDDFAPQVAFLRRSKWERVPHSWYDARVCLEEIGVASRNLVGSIMRTWAGRLSEEGRPHSVRFLRVRRRAGTATSSSAVDLI